MPDGLTVRDADQADVPAIIGLWTEMMGCHAELDPVWTLRDGAGEGFEAFLRSTLESRVCFVLVAELEGAPVGYLLARIGELPPVFLVRERGEICDLAVTAKHRRQGIGTMLVNSALRRFHEQGLREVELSVAVCNPTSQSFWRSMGFQPLLLRLLRKTNDPL